MSKVRRYIKIVPGVTEALQKKKTPIYWMINDGRLPRPVLPGVLDEDELADAQAKLLAARDDPQAA
jgi:hypothetical protein